jgi:hypothetical protein
MHERELRRQPRTAARRLSAVPAVALAVAALTGGQAQAQTTGAHQPPAVSAAVTGDLPAVSAVSATDAWAVGRVQGSAGWNGLAEHWNGRGWTAVPVPAPVGSGGTYLQGVRAVSASDVWAVGNYVRATDQAGLTLAEHWNGKKWAVVPSPSPAISNNSVLLAVSAVSRTDVWAAGYYADATGSPLGLIEHWNGRSWTQVATPAPANGYAVELESVSARSASDVWAAGHYLLSGAEFALTEHWNGQKWTVVTTPSAPGSPDSELHGITAVSGTDAWATGFYFSGSIYKSLIEHWNGHQWQQVASPNPAGSSDTYLYGTSAASGTNAWAVGYYYKTGLGYATLTEHWNGKAWTVVPSPDPAGITSNYLYGVSTLSGTAAWATGYDFGTSDRALVETWNGQKWQLGGIH